MIILSKRLREPLRANALAQAADPLPLLKLFHPASPATWLATELAEDGDMLFGLVDLGFGPPVTGGFSLLRLGRLRLSFGLRTERDAAFRTVFPLSVWLDQARRTGSIMAAETMLAGRVARPLSNPELPPDA
jgi:hypothetical protein